LPRKSVAPFTSPTRSDRLGADVNTYARSDVGDELLMMRYQRGDRVAFQSLLRRHQRNVYNYLLRREADPERAEALAHEVFLTVVQRASEYTQELRFRSWLFGIVRGVQLALQASSPRSRDRAQRPLELVAERREADRSEPRLDRPERTSYSSAVSERVVSVVQALPDAQQEALLLKELGGLTLKEVADAMGLSESSAGQHLRAALEALHKALSSFEEHSRGLR
jgi:RNA polymerase sigma-70 factor (ECF subfamily)